MQVPKGWKRNASGVWVDYSDPNDAKHKVRLLVENSGAGSPRSFLGGAEDFLENKSTTCPDPYERRQLDEITIDDREGAVLEYTCGTGDSARHGIWAAVLTKGKAYSFYLTATEAQFADSKPIFDQMLETYTLEAA